MRKAVKTFANINIIIGVLLMIVPIGLLIFVNIGQKGEVLAAFEPQKEDAILTTPIIDTASANKYTFTDPFLSDTYKAPKIKPLQFSVNDSVTTTGASI